MKYFEKYTSNSLAGTGNQSCFISDGENHIGRIFYKVFSGGKYNYSFLFSNIIDSRFTEITSANCVMDNWEIVKARVAVADDCSNPRKIEGFADLTFGNADECELPNGFFCSKPVLLNAEKGKYICVELTFRGDKVPDHPESQVMSYVYENNRWIRSVEMPVVHCVGCDRTVKRRIAFLGDSITQGIGPEFNSYEHWCAQLAEKIGEEYSFWNLGIGCGRAQDAASDGAWLAKAKENDIVFVCYGVNDIIGDRASADDVKKRLDTICDKLTDKGVKVIIQSIPPFNYRDEFRPIWEDVNEYIKNNISRRVSGYFDNVPILCGDEPYMSKYEKHPNAEGCRKWADELYRYWCKISPNL